MATARKLPSGSWNCKVYSHTEKIKLPDGTTKDKRIYKSFTCDIPGPQGKRACEKMAAEWAAEKERLASNSEEAMTLGEATDKYIESRVALGRSPSTIQGYRYIRQTAFQDLMDKQVSRITIRDIQAALEVEMRRKLRKGTVPSPKRIKNEWLLISSVLHRYGNKNLDLDKVELPQVNDRFVALPTAETVFHLVKGTEIELPVLLAAWLSFSMSEILGLTKSKSINGDYISIREVVVNVSGKPIRKSMAKNPTRNRTHRIPPYIKSLIDQVQGDVIVPLSSRALYEKWIAIQRNAGMEPITFHDLRHLNASVMAMLRIPDKYAQERGGWKTDQIMKRIYTQTFPEERVRVDDIIDGYFDGIMQHEMQHKK